jgi:hypothetical protein
MFIQYSVKNFTFKHKTAPVFIFRTWLRYAMAIKRKTISSQAAGIFPKQAKKPVLLQDRPIFIHTKQRCRDVCFNKADKLRFSYDSVQNISWSKSTLAENPAER